MIPNQWYAIMESHEVKTKPVGVTRLNEKLVLWRDLTGQVQCIFDRCCHRGASLSVGCLEGDHLACPFHGFRYDGTGKVVAIPANGLKTPVPDRYKVNHFPVKEAYGFIWLWYGHLKDMTETIPFFENLTENFVYKTFSEVWEVHYTRAIENQLDVVHLPFVHKTTIGKGIGTLVNGPVVEWEGNRMTFYVDNVQDHGQKPLKPDEIANYRDLFHLQYQVPNIWQNILTDKALVFAAFVPIDDSHTKIYIRFYQRFLPIPVLGKAMAHISNIFNKVILHQDRDVVITQRPLASHLKMDEMLIQGDLPIIEFRKKRQTLKKEVEYEIH